VIHRDITTDSYGTLLPTATAHYYQQLCGHMEYSLHYFIVQKNAVKQYDKIKLIVLPEDGFPWQGTVLQCIPRGLTFKQYLAVHETHSITYGWRQNNTDWKAANLTLSLPPDKPFLRHLPRFDLLSLKDFFILPTFIIRWQSNPVLSIADTYH
jgi:hypothetical protein